MIMVEATSTAMPPPTIHRVRRLQPFHSLSAIPQRLLKTMMKAMWSVQLEKSYSPMRVVPMP